MRLLGPSPAAGDVMEKPVKSIAVSSTSVLDVGVESVGVTESVAEEETTKSTVALSSSEDPPVLPSSSMAIVMVSLA